MELLPIMYLLGLKDPVALHPMFIYGGEEYSAIIYFLQNKYVQGSNHDSNVEDVKNIVYCPVALKQRAIYMSGSQ
jgi:hypothetical protein